MVWGTGSREDGKNESGIGGELRYGGGGGLGQADQCTTMEEEGSDSEGSGCKKMCAETDGVSLATRSHQVSQ